MLDHIQAKTFHARRGDIKNAFSYGVDFVLTDFQGDPPLLFSRNRFNLWSLHDRNHGGKRGDGVGLKWFQDLLHARGFPFENARFLLLAQPALLGLHFNPVSFWIAMVEGQPRAFVAEVNSTFGQRHCYFCAHDDFRPIAKNDTLHAQKLMHVSPFQRIEGGYDFNFELSQERVHIRIFFRNGDQGVFADLKGTRRPASAKSLIWAALRRPFGGMRVLALIHFQAAILYLKRAPFLKKQPGPGQLLSESRNFRRSAK